MAIDAITGQNTTVSFSGLGAISCVRSISLPEFSLESVDASCIDDATPNSPPGASVNAEFTKKIPGMLVDAGEVQITMVFAPIDSFHIPNGVQDTISVTLPAALNAGSGRVLSGTGFISSCQAPSIELNGLLEQTITFAFDGDTGPLLT